MFYTKICDPGLCHKQLRSLLFLSFFRKYYHKKLNEVFRGFNIFQLWISKRFDRSNIRGGNILNFDRA